MKIREGLNAGPIKIWLKMDIELAKWTKTEDMKTTCFPPGDPAVPAAHPGHDR